MTLDQLNQRDRTIAELEAKGRARTRDEDHDLARLHALRDHQWRRLPLALATARHRAAELEAYARQHSLALDPVHA